MKSCKKTAVVIGGGGSIGGAICRELAGSGYCVAVCDYSLSAAQLVAESINLEGTVAKAFFVNVRKNEDIAALTETVMDKYKHVDVLVYSAGGSARSNTAMLANIKPEVIDNVIGVNLIGALYCTRAFIPRMMARKSGKIIYIASILGINGKAHHSEYSAAKGGIIAMTKALAKELGPYGININCVSPGLVPRQDQMTEECLKSMADKSYINRVTMPEDIAGVVGFLASEAGNLIVGQNYIVDGGRSLANKGDD
jgi:3-oxoacyl-[acyl-carrier protein] reductase